MTSWKVDPDGVLGVLAGVDEQGPVLESALKGMSDLDSDGAAVLTKDGRTAVSEAWTRFLSERKLVPGGLMYALRQSAQSVSAATAEVVGGDEQMADDTFAAQQYAEDVWGISIPAAYQAPMPGA